MREFVQGETLLREDKLRVKQAFAAAREAAEEAGLELRLPRIGPRVAPAGASNCDWPWRGLYLSYQGYVMPCCMIGTPDRFSFGCALDAGGPLAVWEGQGYEAFRRQLLNGAPPEICRSCALYRGVF